MSGFEQKLLQVMKSNAQFVTEKVRQQAVYGKGNTPPQVFLVEFRVLFSIKSIVGDGAKPIELYKPLMESLLANWNYKTFD